jgi:TolA-binding protein
MDNEDTSISMFLGEIKSDINSMKNIQEKHSKKLEDLQEILQQMAKTEVILTNIIQNQTKSNEFIQRSEDRFDKINDVNQKKINELDTRIKKNEDIVKVLKWAFGIITIIFTSVTIAAFKGILGI